MSISIRRKRSNGSLGLQNAGSFSLNGVLRTSDTPVSEVAKALDRAIAAHFGGVAKDGLEAAGAVGIDHGW